MNFQTKTRHGVRSITVGIVAFLGLFAFLAACQDSGTTTQAPSPMSSQARGSAPAPPPPSSAPILNTSSDIAMYKEAVKVDPKNANAWIGLGNTLMDAGKFKDAIEAYGKALEIQPGNVNVRVDMGTCFRRAGKPDIAVAAYRKALEIEPNHVNANLNLGVVLLYDLNDVPGAIAAWEKFLSLDPAHPNANAIRNELSKLKAVSGGKG